MCEPVLLGILCLGTFLLYAFFAFTKWPLENIPLNHIYLSKGSKNHLTMHMIQFSYTIYTNLAKKNMTGLMVINMLKMQYSKQLLPTLALTTCLPERIVILLKGRFVMSYPKLSSHSKPATVSLFMRPICPGITIMNQIKIPGRMSHCRRFS